MEETQLIPFFFVYFRLFKPFSIFATSAHTIVSLSAAALKAQLN